MVPVGKKLGHSSSTITASSSSREHNHTNTSICVKSGCPCCGDMKHEPIRRLFHLPDGQGNNGICAAKCSEKQPVQSQITQPCNSTFSKICHCGWNTYVTAPSVGPAGYCPEEGNTYFPTIEDLWRHQADASGTCILPGLSHLPSVSMLIENGGDTKRRCCWFYDPVSQSCTSKVCWQCQKSPYPKWFVLDVCVCNVSQSGRSLSKLCCLFISC